MAIQQSDIMETNVALEKAKGFWANFRKPIIYIGSAVILLIGGWLAYKYLYEAPNEEKASDLIFPAEKLFSKMAATSNFNKDSVTYVLKGDKAQGITGMLDIIKKYGDIDPDNIKNTEYEKTGVKIETIFFNNLIPRKMDPTLIMLRASGVKLYRDFDLYTFFIKLIFINENIKTFFLEKNINNTIMSFMSKAFLNSLYSKKIKVINMSESAYIAIEIFGKINENMINVFTDEYIGRLQELNYRLFK